MNKRSPSRVRNASGRWPGWFGGGARVACLLLSGLVCAAAEERTTVEYQVKAAFLFNFAKFIEWPPEAFANEEAPIQVCVFRYDPFGASLDGIVKGKIINQRKLAVRRVNVAGELSGCQLVFIGEKEEKGLGEVLSSVNGNSVLVVGETEGFAERGGGIQFFLEDQRLRFAVNVDVLQRARLSVSSKLLVLARIVRDANAKGS
jgi:hypothetical protein